MFEMLNRLQSYTVKPERAASFSLPKAMPQQKVSIFKN
jgi:hypothetical protein